MYMLNRNFSLILCPAEDISHLDSFKRMSVFRTIDKLSSFPLVPERSVTGDVLG